MTFLSKYLNGNETSLNLSQRNKKDNDTEVNTRFDMSKNIRLVLGSERAVPFDRKELEEMNKCILFNWE